MPYTIQKVQNEADFLSAFEIRKEVFVKEQGVDEKLEHDNYEKNSIHFLVKDLDLPIGTARVRETPIGMKIERFTIIRPYRGRGIGKMLGLEILKFLTEEKPGSVIYLNAQVQVISFYEDLGFVVEGESFQEAGIWHKKMVKAQ